jgi:hypothetical protein
MRSGKKVEITLIVSSTGRGVIADHAAWVGHNLLQPATTVGGKFRWVYG